MGSLRSLRRRERPEPIPLPKPSDAELIEAIYHGTFKDVQALLKQQANANALSPRGTTALAVAALRGKLRMVQALVKHGADVNRRNADNSTALHTALSSLWKMVPKICRFLVNHGADINAVDSYGRTPLMAAVVFKEFDLAQFLLERGADSKLRDKNWKRAVDLIGHGKGSKALRKFLKQIL